MRNIWRVSADERCPLITPTVWLSISGVVFGKLAMRLIPVYRDIALGLVEQRSARRLLAADGMALDESLLLFWFRQ